MLGALLTIAITTLVLTFVISYVILRRAISDRGFRRFLMWFVFLTPFVALYGFAKALFSRPKTIVYSADLGRIEDKIEGERARIFDTSIMHPSFSYKWRLSYLYAVEKSATQMARFDPSIGNSLQTLRN